MKSDRRYVRCYVWSGMVSFMLFAYQAYLGCAQQPASAGYVAGQDIVRLSGIGRRLPPDLFQENILKPLVMPYPKHYMRPDKPDVGQAYGHYVALKDMISAYTLPPTGHEFDDLLAAWSGLPYQAVRTAVRALFAGSKVLQDTLAESSMYNWVTWLDLVIESDGTQPDTDMRFILEHSRALVVPWVIKPVIAAALECLPEEVDQVIDREYGTQLVALPDFKVYRDFYTYYPWFDAAMRQSLDTGRSYIGKAWQEVYQPRGTVLLKRKKYTDIPFLYRYMYGPIPRSFFKLYRQRAAQESIKQLEIDITTRYFPAGLDELADQLVKLKVSGLDAYTLPAQVGNLVKVKKLELSGHLHTLPPEITHLTHLKGKGSLVLPHLDLLPDTPRMRDFLIKQTRALTPQEYQKLVAPQGASETTPPTRKKISWKNWLRVLGTQRTTREPVSALPPEDELQG